MTDTTNETASMTDTTAEPAKGKDWRSNPRPGRPTRRHELLRGCKPGVFYPGAVGRVPGYPKSPEAFAKRQEAMRERRASGRAPGGSRKGVCDGWGRKPYERAALREKAARQAEIVTPILFGHNGGPRLEPDDDRPMSREGREAYTAEAALKVVVEIALCPAYAPANRLLAMRIVLDWTVPKLKGGRPAAADGLGFLTELAETLEAAHHRCAADAAEKGEQAEWSEAERAKQAEDSDAAPGG